MVAELAGAHLISERDVAAGDDTAADSRAQRQQRELLRALTDAVHVLAQRRAAGVVADEHPVAWNASLTRSPSGTFSQPKFGEKRIVPETGSTLPGEPMPIPTTSCFAASIADFMTPVNAAMTALGARSRNVVLEADADLADLVDHRRHDVRPAEVDADRSLRHYPSPPLYRMRRASRPATRSPPGCEPPGPPPSYPEVIRMQETIDLIAHRELRNLRRFTRETGQPTRLADLDLEPMKSVASIEIDEEHITIQVQQVDDAPLQQQRHDPKRMGLQI